MYICLFLCVRVCYHHMRATKIDINLFTSRKCFSCASFLLRIIKHFNETKFQSLFSNLRKLRQCTLQCIAFKRFQLNVNYMDVSILRLMNSLSISCFQLILALIELASFEKRFHIIYELLPRKFNSSANNQRINLSDAINLFQ